MKYIQLSHNRLGYSLISNKEIKRQVDRPSTGISFAQGFLQFGQLQLSSFPFQLQVKMRLNCD